MNKEEIFEKLNELDLDKEKYIVISGASLTVQGITSISSDIVLVVVKNIIKLLIGKLKMDISIQKLNIGIVMR